MRVSRTLSGLALVAAALAPSTPVHALDGEMCQGRPATIVGGIGTVTGTEGDDVIVVNTQPSSLTEVKALDGDDTICVNGPLPVDDGPEDIVSFVVGGPGKDSLQVVASDGEDDLEVHDVETVDINMLGGADRLLVSKVTESSVVDGGAGANRLTIWSSRPTVIDVEDELLEVGGVGGRLSGFQKIRVDAQQVELTGSAKDEVLQAWGCRLEIRGGGGDDFLSAASQSKSIYSCTKGAVLLGQKGRDRLRGTVWDDRLIGGPGRDQANGKRGSDRCDAEVERACER